MIISRCIVCASEPIGSDLLVKSKNTGELLIKDFFCISQELAPGQCLKESLHAEG